MATEFISNSWLMPTNANAEANRVSNYSLDFDSASSQYLNFGTSLGDSIGDNYTDSISFSLWFKANTTTGDDGLIWWSSSSPSNGELSVWIQSNNINVQMYGGSTQSYSFTDTSNWHHLVITLKPSGSKMYLDNIDTGLSWTYSDLDVDNNTLYIGTYYSTSYTFDGNITEASVFDYELSSSQVTELYGTGSAIGNPMAITNGRKPVAYYPLSNSGFNSEFLVPNGAEQDFVFDFNASSNNYIEVANNSSLQITDNLTLSCWINADNVSATNSIIDKFYDGADRSYLLRISGTRVKLYLGNTDGSSAPEYQSSSTLSNNVWYHVVTTFSSTDNEVKIYINGSLDSTHSKTDLISSNNEELRIGTGYNLANYFDGKMSNAAIFNTALPATGTESVASLYNYGTPPNIASYSGLQGWWELDASATFDGSNWSIPDASSNSNTGTSSNMTAASLIQSDLTINAPYDSFSLNFDSASSDYIDCGTISSFDDGDITFSLWCNLTSNGTVQYILSSTNSSSVSGINIAVNNSGLLYFERSQDAANTQNFTSFYVVTGFSFGNWHHLCGTYSASSGELKAYVDGVLKSTTTDSADARAASTALKIGGLSASSSFPSNGKISNVSIYNSELSAAQVTTLYNEGKPFDLNTFAVTPVAWWRLGAVNSSFDGANWTVLDEIGTNNGTSANMTQSDLVDGVGATGSGTSSGMGSGENRIGSAPFSESNSVSYNMSVTAKSTSVPT